MYSVRVLATKHLKCLVLARCGASPTAFVDLWVPQSLWCICVGHRHIQYTYASVFSFV